MRRTQALITAALLSGLAGTALAAKNPLSVHVLNTQNGLPSAGVDVTLEMKTGDGWTRLNEATTNDVGRINGLYPEGDALENGTYRVTFETGEWFAEHDGKTFFPEIPVVFQLDGALDHYHIPLLLSPYGFSTYRGN